MEMSAIDKAVAIIELLASAKEEMSIRELERESNISKSTIHRILQKETDKTLSIPAVELRGFLHTHSCELNTMCLSSGHQ